MKPRRAVHEIRTRDHPNATTRTGRIVHASTRHGYPLCGRYLYGIVYTADVPNCPSCATTPDQSGLTLPLGGV